MRRRLAAYALILAVTLTGCSRPPHTRQAPAVTEADVSVAATSAAPAVTATAPPSASAAPSSTETVRNGVYDCYVRGVDRRGGGALIVVFATVFTGADAERAAEQADEQLAAGVHSYVRVDDPRERRLELRGLKPPDPPHDGLYRVTVRDGAVTAIAEEKLP